MKDWEFQRLPEAAEVERRFSEALEQLSNKKYSVLMCGRGVEGVELPIEAVEHIDYALVRHGRADKEFIGFIDVVGRDCAIDSYPDYVVRDYKGAFIEKALQYDISTFIVQEMKREPINRYMWVEGDSVIKYPLKMLERKIGEPQCNHHVPLTEWQRGIETFINYVKEWPDVTLLYLTYKNVLMYPLDSVGYIDE